MNTKPLKDSLPDEHLLQVEPRPKPSVETDWRSRPNLYAGRALSAEALASEQRERSGHLALRGQMVSPGIVTGLEVRLEVEETGDEEPPVYYLHISPGMGLTAGGEDVVLNRLHRVPLRKVPAFWEGSLGPVGFDLSVLYGQTDEVLAATHSNLQAAVLMLVPVVSRKDHTTDTAQPVELDPENGAFEDQRLVDGSALVLYAWPREWPLPPRTTEQDKAVWRNRLAWEIFNREQQRPSGQCAPWEEIGVPLALVGFEKPADVPEPPPTPPSFIDRASVVRTGGAPRGRTPLLESRGSPLLWQARSLQFAEQLSSFSSEQLSSTTASASFDLLPPLGTLPKEAIDLFTWQRRFFPAPFLLDAVPVPLEQLDAVAQASASLAPLRTSHSERVRILVPVPEAHFEPHLLQEELLDPFFPRAISSALGRLGQWLARRKDLRKKAVLLKDALAGVKPEHKFPDEDPGAVLGERPSDEILPPKEEAYETDGDRIPAFDALFLEQIQGGNWTPASVLGFSADQVSTATSESLDRFGVVTRSQDTLLFTRSSKGASTWDAWEHVDASQPFIKEIKALWSGSELVIVALVCEPTRPVSSQPTTSETTTTSGSTTTKTVTTTTTTTTPLSGDTVLDVSIAIGSQDSGGRWSWRKTAHRLASEVLAFTAVCWKQGFIDAFVATKTEVTTVTTKEKTVTTVTTNTDGSVTTTVSGTREITTVITSGHEILTFPWVQGLTAQPPSELLLEDKWVASMVALSSEDPPAAGATASNDWRIELLFLGKQVPKETKTTTTTETLPTTTKTTRPTTPSTTTTTPTRTPTTTTPTTTTTKPPTTTTTTTPTTTTKPPTTTTTTTTTTTAPRTLAQATPMTRAPTVRLATPTSLAPAATASTTPPTLATSTAATTAEPPQPTLFHLSGVHKGEAAPLSQRKFIEVSSIQGTLLSACWTLKKNDGGKWLKQFDVLVMGSKGIFHTWYNEGWSPSSLPVSLTSQVGESTYSALVADSERDGRIHAFWWTRDFGPDSSAKNTLIYRRFENNAWGLLKAVLQEVTLAVDPQRFGKPVGAVVNATARLELFLASDAGLQHVRMLAGTTNALLQQQGLQGLIDQNEALLGRVNDFISAGSSQVQADTQNVRQLMLSGSTEASRLVVSPILGATMVQSPLAARTDIESYLTHFLRKSTALVSGAAAEPTDQLNSEADAQETLEQATATRRDLTARLIEFVKELDLDVTGMAVLGVARVSTSGVIEFSPAGDPRAKNISRDSFPLENLVASDLQRDQVLNRISGEPEAIRNFFDPQPPAAPPAVKWKTSDYFSISVHHLENTLVLLQELERRMDAPIALLEQYKVLREKLEAAMSALQERLRVVDGEVAEARQDVTVGRALLAEEEARIGAINARRGEVFAKYVPFLVFQRPRESDLTRDTSSRVLDPALGMDILPEVFASTAAAPPELLAYTELVRDSPLKWFSLAPQLLRGLDRLDLIHRTFEWAYTRVVQRRPVQLPLIAGRTSPRYAQGLSQLLSAREAVLNSGRLSYFQYFQPAVLYTRTWLELQQSAHEQLSLGDLIDTAQGRPEVSRSAATELEHITKAALGLYQRFGEVLPALRLQWAEQFSQYDGPVDLHDLSRLPRWGQLEITHRRELQRLVDWLFQRVVPGQKDAASLMNDLVRVCLLLASHAPVNELLSGHVHKPTVAKVGGSVELAVEPSRVRIGMYVMIRSGNQTVQAVVEDLSAGVVRARVLSTSAAGIALKAKQTVHFSDPGRGTGTLLPFVGTRR